MQFQKRSPAAVLLLSIVTCGIYSCYVIYQISKEIRDFRGDVSVDPAIELILCILTGGIYEIYWFYKYSKLVYDMQLRCETVGPSDLSIVLLVLAVLRLNLVGLMLLQGELNRVWDTVSPATPYQQ